ncbi:hypothetical protein [Laspinema palackyanum]|uniref:hypothetical protein n=1 Tax=Laspinema palackyanum TaxID=3231601 RepID=UPI00345CA464|nr:hypothetical protein [Laspinema sp. D2c]
MHEVFIDLDELILRCRDKVSRKFIQEAVSCYRAGAFRSCIVATWNAVVFDFLHKLRELELFGDKEAERLLQEFDKFRSSGNKFKELWKFESDIPEVALTKFELISTVEQSDIKRLFEDRSRCAHPSMTSLEEPFEATAELARYHLRSAVTHLLARPPVQGRAARDRIFQDIESEYFPTDPESASKYFQKGPLARARLTLVRDIVLGLTTDLLIKERSEDEKLRQFSALNAVSIMYPQQTRDILNDKLSDIIINKVTDEKWDKTIIYLGSITAWDFLSEPCRLKAQSYIDKLEIYQANQSFLTKFYKPKELSEKFLLILIKASQIEFLKELVIQKFHIPLMDLLSLKEICKDEVFKEKIILPILRDLSLQATLDELLSMIADSSFSSDETIKFYINNKIKDSSLKELIEILYYPNLEQWVFDLIDSELEVKISKSYASNSENLLLSKNIEPLIELKSVYKYLKCEFKTNVIDLINKSVYQSFEEVSFNDFLSLPRQYWNVIDEEQIKVLLKNNTGALINKFVNSNRFDSAETHSIMIVKIAENLTPEQWKNILEAFFENDQIYFSWNCYKNFEELFKKSCNLSKEFREHLKPYWITFRDELNRLDWNPKNSPKQLVSNSKSLKELINNYYG